MEETALIGYIRAFACGARAALAAQPPDVRGDEARVRLEIPRDEVRRLLRAQREGRGNYGMRIWALVNFALWYRHWMEGESF